MNILVFTTLYPNNVFPNHGVFVKERMTRVSKLEGHRVTVVAPVPYYPPVRIGHRWKYSQVVRNENREGVPVLHPKYFMTPKVGMSAYGYMLLWSVLPVIRRLQKEFEFDIIDSHYVYPDGFAAVRLGRILKKPVIVSARGSDINQFADYPLIRPLLRSTLSRADHVVAVCQALKDAMVSLGVPARKISVIPNGVDQEKFFPVPKEEARRRLGLPDRRILLSVGNLIPRKGFDLLIRALALLQAENGERDLLLAIVGDGPEKKDLERTIVNLGLQDKVRLVGAEPHENLYLWYSAADLFCLSSSREGWPNVVMEAMACGTPILATNVWGIPEIVQSEEIGLLTERTETKIAEGMREALRKTWQRSHISDYARSQTWDKVALSVTGLFRAVVDGKAAV